MHGVGRTGMTGIVRTHTRAVHGRPLRSTLLSLISIWLLHSHHCTLWHSHHCHPWSRMGTTRASLTRLSLLHHDHSLTRMPLHHNHTLHWLSWSHTHLLLVLLLQHHHPRCSGHSLTRPRHSWSHWHSLLGHHLRLLLHHHLLLLSWMHLTARLGRSWIDSHSFFFLGSMVMSQHCVLFRLFSDSFQCLLYFLGVFGYLVKLVLVFFVEIVSVLAHGSLLRIERLKK